METIKNITEWIAVRGISIEQLLESSALDPRVLEAIVRGRYTPSPQQRQRLAAILAVTTEQICWEHTTQVDHIYGHGPQFGRSP